MKRRISACLLVVAMLLSMLPMSAFAADTVASGTCGDNLTWKLNGDGVLTISGAGEMCSFSWGGSPWYEYRENILKVVVEDGVTNIGDNAFSGCSSLTSITIPDSVTSIREGAFYGCSSLTDITIPDNVTSIGGNAFYGCWRLTSISIPDSVTSIGDNAFCGCNSLTSITIPDSVTSIGDYAFSDCSSLTSISIPDSVTSIGNYTFFWCSSLTSISIPDSVTSIGDSAFSECRSLTSITIPDSVTSIGDSAFSYCSSLTSISIPDSVTSIGNYTFFWCSSLTSITIPDGVTNIGDSAFSGCSSLTSISIPDSVTSIGDNAFYGCSSLTSISIPDSVTSIGDNAFLYCNSLDKIIVEENNIYYSSDERGVLFNKENTELIKAPGAMNGSYIVPDGVISIGGNAFCGCWRLTSISMPDSVTSIGDYAFSGCSSLTSIIIPDSVTSIGDNAFYGCSSLTSISIPDSVTSIGDNAFLYCNSLDKIIVEENNIYYSSDERGVLFNKEKTELIQAPGAMNVSYAIPDSVTSIGDYAFYGCSSLTDITIPDNVTSIGGNAFYGCWRLTSISIPDSVTSIGDNAFCGCNSLTSITIPDSVTSIGDYAFSDCSSLTSINFLGDAPTLYYSCFYGVTATAYYPAGNETWTADVMKNYGGTLTWEAYEKESDPAPTIALKYPTVSFEDEVIMDVFFDVTDLGSITPDKMGLITFTSEVADGTVENADAVIPGAVLNDATGFYSVHTNGISAKNLGDEIYFRVYIELPDGSYVYSKMVHYSPKTYAYTVLNGNYSSNMKSLVAAMLNYGAAAQVYFGHNTDALINADMTDAHKAHAEDYNSSMIAPVVKADSAKAVNFVSNGGFSRRYPSISFESAFCINYFFAPAYAVEGDITLYYWTAADYNGADVLTIENATGSVVATSGSEYEAAVKGIAAKDLDSTIYVAAVYKSGSTICCSGVLAYSIGAYCLDRITNGSAAMQGFAAATAVYGYYAKAYFAK